MKVAWDWKQQLLQVGSFFLLGAWYAGLGVVLGRWGGGGPWFCGMAGCPWWGFWLLVLSLFFMWQCGVPKGFRLPSK